MLGPLRYRPFEEDDLYRVLRLANDALGEDYDGGMFLHFARLYPDGFIVAEVEGEIIGFVMGSIQKAYEARILALAVDEEYRRQGIGTRLTEQFLANFRDHGVERVTLEVRVSNQAAIEMYRELGFTPESVVEAYYGDDEDAYVMACAI